MWATQDLFRTPACVWLIELFPLLDGLATVLALPAQTHKPCSMTGLFLIHVHSLRARSSMGMQQRLAIAPHCRWFNQHILTGRITHCATPVNSLGVVKLEKTPTQTMLAV